jgi:hypothetical protein
LHLCINTINMLVALLWNKSSIILLEAITTQGSKAKYLFTGHYHVQTEQLSTSRFKLSLLLSCAGQLGTSWLKLNYVFIPKSNANAKLRDNNSCARVE